MVLYKIVCPVWTLRRRKSYTIRKKDKKILCSGGLWRSVGSVIRRTKAASIPEMAPERKERTRQNKRNYYGRNTKTIRTKAREHWNSRPEEWRKAQSKKRMDNAKKHVEHRRYKARIDYAKHRIDRLRQLYENRRKRDPACGLNKTLCEFRRGEIALSELNKRFSEALKRIDELGKADTD